MQMFFRLGLLITTDANCCTLWSQATCLVWYKPEIPAEHPRTMEVHISQVSPEPEKWARSNILLEIVPKYSCLNNSLTASCSKISPLEEKEHLHCQHTGCKAGRHSQIREAETIKELTCFFSGISNLLMQRFRAVLCHLFSPSFRSTFRR